MCGRRSERKNGDGGPSPLQFQPADHEGGDDRAKRLRVRRSVIEVEMRNVTAAIALAKHLAREIGRMITVYDGDGETVHVV